VPVGEPKTRAAAVTVLAFGHQHLGEEAAVGHLLPLGAGGGCGALGADGGQPQHPAGGVDGHVSAAAVVTS